MASKTTVLPPFIVPLKSGCATFVNTVSNFPSSICFNILVDLYLASGEDKEVFEHGIIFIDEFDKMCKNFNIQSDENKYMMLPEIFRERTQGQHLKEMLQNEFLSIVQGTVINKKIRDGFIEKNVSLDTSKITFIFAGAFEEIIKRENISTNDLIEYGMIPQLAKRIHSLIKTKLPTKEDLRNALISSLVRILLNPQRIGKAHSRKSMKRFCQCSALYMKSVPPDGGALFMFSAGQNHPFRHFSPHTGPRPPQG